jgi:hypothetical protein
MSSFVSCDTDFVNVSIKVISDTTQEEFCVAFNSNHSRWQATDPFSIATIEMASQSIDYVYLGPHIAFNLDGYSQLNYIYGESCLITMTGFRADWQMYSTKMHTHARPPPAIQNIWINFDPMFVSI